MEQPHQPPHTCEYRIVRKCLPECHSVRTIHTQVINIGSQSPLSSMLSKVDPACSTFFKWERRDSRICYCLLPSPPGNFIKASSSRSLCFREYRESDWPYDRSALHNDELHYAACTFTPTTPFVCKFIPSAREFFPKSILVLDTYQELRTHASVGYALVLQYRSPDPVPTLRACK
jgi:hypothetical protein